jgi:hypothetical protein
MVPDRRSFRISAHRCAGLWHFVLFLIDPYWDLTVEQSLIDATIALGKALRSKFRQGDFVCLLGQRVPQTRITDETPHRGGQFLGRLRRYQ